MTDDPTPRPPALDGLLGYVEARLGRVETQVDSVEKVRRILDESPDGAELTFGRDVVEMLLASVTAAEQAARLDHEVTGGPADCHPDSTE